MATQTYRLDEIDTWRDYYARLDRGGPYHEPAYIRLLEGYLGATENVAELFVYEDDDGFVYYPYFLRTLETVSFAEKTSVDTGSYRDAVASWYYGGPLASAGASSDTVEQARAAFGKHCRDAGIVSEFLRFDPNLANHETFSEVDPEFNRHTVPVDLTQSDDELWDGFEKRNRNAIRQGQQSSLEIEPSTDTEDYRAFYEIYSNAMEAQDASEHYRFPFEFFERLLNIEERSTLLVARDDATVVGGALVVHDGEVAHDYLRASNPDYWDQRVNNLLCYEALMHMRDRGHKLFDFQGGRPGVFKFKKAFSPDRREFYIGKEIHLPDVYDQLIEDAAAAGIDTEKDYFPTYRVDRSN